MGGDDGGDVQHDVRCCAGTRRGTVGMRVMQASACAKLVPQYSMFCLLQEDLIPLVRAVLMVNIICSKQEYHRPNRALKSWSLDLLRNKRVMP